jgi:hypothetical protein
MKVQYNIKPCVEDFAYMADLTFQDLNPHQLEFIRNVLYCVLQYNTTFSEEEHDQLGGQNLINQISAYFKK